MLDIKNQNNNSVKVEPNRGPRPRPELELPPLEPQKNYLSLFSVLAVILIIIVAIGLYVIRLTNASALKTKDAEMQSLSDELGTNPLKDLDLQMIGLQAGIIAFQRVVSGELYYSKLFTELEKRDPKNVKLTAFSLDDKGLIKLSGEASDFTSIAKLIRSLENSSMFDDVKLVSSTSADSKTGAKLTFSLTLSVKTSELKKTNTSASPVNPNNNIGNIPAETVPAAPQGISNQ